MKAINPGLALTVGMALGFIGLITITTTIHPNPKVATLLTFASITACALSLFLNSSEKIKKK